MRFFISDIVAFNSRCSFFKKLLSMYLLNFLDIWNIVIMTVLISLSANFNICCQFWVWFSSLIIFLNMDHVFLLLCMAGNLWLDLRHCEFYLVQSWLFLHSCKYSWFFPPLFGMMKLNYLERIDPFESCFYDLLGISGEVLSRAHYFPLLRQELPVYSTQ